MASWSRLHPQLWPSAPEVPSMRNLHAALAGIRCWEASWRLGARDLKSADESVRRLIAEAAGHLGARGLVRDPREIWRPVLGSPDNLPGRVRT
jgi:hypothetical protein